jgi:hypothetical protein
MSPASALDQVAERLRGERSVIASFVIEPTAPPVLGPLAAAGPRAASDPAEYSFVVESIREGYELHYGASHVLRGQDESLSLLAGDYLYALGLERLAALRDPEAVVELSDLISLSAACHAEGNEAAVPPLWLSTAVAVGCGGGKAHEEAKVALRLGHAGAAASLREAAEQTARAEGVEDSLGRARESIDFAVPETPDLG